MATRPPGRRRYQSEIAKCGSGFGYRAGCSVEHPELIGARVPHRFASAPLLKLLRQASLKPDQVDAAIDLTGKPWTYSLLRADHPLPAALRQATGVEVVTIARRYHRLLLEVDTRHEGKRQWHYQELGRHKTVLKCQGSLPHILAAAAIGRTVSEVTADVQIASDATIAEANSSVGRLTLHLNTIWIGY